jgi:hypothetical protein
VNDLEAKLRNLAFREPPPGLRGAVLASAKSLSNWLAPHPVAWAALAALWLALAALDALLNGPNDTALPREKLARVEMPQTPVLLAFYKQAGAGEPAL